jgi:hypothetical protein
MQARRAMNDLERYRGYLSLHVEHIRTMHLTGAHTHTIASVEPFLESIVHIIVEA